MVTIRKQTKITKKMGGIADLIKPMDFEDEGLKINVYGRSATGKTTFWSTFPKPILCLKCSGGGELRSINTKENRKVIRQVDITESGLIREVVEHQKEEKTFGTVVLDHASGLNDLVLKEILDLEELPAQKSWGMATQQQYGQASLQMKELIRAVLGLKCNVVIVAQERDFNTDSDAAEHLMPYVASALTPSVVGWLNPAVDYIVRTFIREQTKSVTSAMKSGKSVTMTKATGKYEYCMKTGPDPVYTTKFRRPMGVPLPDVIVNPTYDKLMEIIEGG